MAARDRLVWCAGVAWNAVRGTDQNLSTALGMFSDITYVEPSVSIAKRHLGRSMEAAVATGVSRRVVTGVPGARFDWVRRLNSSLLRARVSAALREWPPATALISTSLDDVMSLAQSDTVKVLVGTDDYVAGAGLMDQDEHQLRRDERRAVCGADLVTAVTPDLARRWEATYGRPVFVLPNGVDVEHYRDVPSMRGPARRRPVAVVIGNLSERLDITLLEALPRNGVDLLLVGPHRISFEPQRFGDLVADPAVTWVGPRRYAELPMLLAQADVGITPYRDSPFNRASFPLKTLEYLAAGLPVVSTPLPAARQLGTQLVFQAEGSEAFACAVLNAAQTSRDQGLVSARQGFAQRHSWEGRALDLMAMLRDVVQHRTTS